MSSITEPVTSVPVVSVRHGGGCCHPVVWVDHEGSSHRVGWLLHIDGHPVVVVAKPPAASPDDGWWGNVNVVPETSALIQAGRPFLVAGSDLSSRSGYHAAQLQAVECGLYEAERVYYFGQECPEPTDEELARVTGGRDHVAWRVSAGWRTVVTLRLRCLAAPRWILDGVARCLERDPDRYQGRLLCRRVGLTVEGGVLPAIGDGRRLYNHTITACGWGSGYLRWYDRETQCAVAIVAGPAEITSADHPDQPLAIPDGETWVLSHPRPRRRAAD